MDVRPDLAISSLFFHILLLIDAMKSTRIFGFHTVVMVNNIVGAMVGQRVWTSLSLALQESTESFSTLGFCMFFWPWKTFCSYSKHSLLQKSNLTKKEAYKCVIPNVTADHLLFLLVELNFVSCCHPRPMHINIAKKFCWLAHNLWCSMSQFRLLDVMPNSLIYWLCLQCFDTAGWASGRASGL